MYKCTINQNEDGGFWEKKETPKTISFTWIESPESLEPLHKMVKASKKDFGMDEDLRTLYWKGKDLIIRNHNCGKDAKEYTGTFTAYPLRFGQPYYFEPYGKNTN